MQNHYNLLYREEEREMLPLCADQGVGVLPWSPLARGRLTRDWDTATSRAQTDEFGATLYRDEDRSIVETVSAVAERRGVSRAQVALAWLLCQPAVTSPIVGVTKPQHLADAVAAVDLVLSGDEVEAPARATSRTASRVTARPRGLRGDAQPLLQRHGVVRRVPLDVVVRSRRTRPGPRPSGGRRRPTGRARRPL